MTGAEPPTSLWSIQGIATLILVGAAGLGALSFLALLLMRGFWAKVGEPVVKAMFLAWQADATETAKRHAETKSVIDNELQRVDGIIRKEITHQVSVLQSEMVKVLSEIKALIALDQSYREQVLTRLGRIEGAMNLHATDPDGSGRFKPVKG